MDYFISILLSIFFIIIYYKFINLNLYIISKHILNIYLLAFIANILILINSYVLSGINVYFIPMFINLVFLIFALVRRNNVLLHENIEKYLTESLKYLKDIGLEYDNIYSVELGIFVDYIVYKYDKYEFMTYNIVDYTTANEMLEKIDCSFKKISRDDRQKYLFLCDKLKYSNIEFNVKDYYCGRILSNNYRTDLLTQKK